jgi:hypothetical protein
MIQVRNKGIVIQKISVTGYDPATEKFTADIEVMTGYFERAFPAADAVMAAQDAGDVATVNGAFAETACYEYELDDGDGKTVTIFLAHVTKAKAKAKNGLVAEITWTLVLEPTHETRIFQLLKWTAKALTFSATWISPDTLADRRLKDEDEAKGQTNLLSLPPNVTVTLSRTDEERAHAEALREREEEDRAHAVALREREEEARRGGLSEGLAQRALDAAIGAIHGSGSDDVAEEEGAMPLPSQRPDLKVLPGGRSLAADIEAQAQTLEAEGQEEAAADLRKMVAEGQEEAAIALGLALAAADEYDVMGARAPKEKG